MAYARQVRLSCLCQELMGFLLAESDKIYDYLKYSRILHANVLGHLYSTMNLFQAFAQVQLRRVYKKNLLFIATCF